MPSITWFRENASAVFGCMEHLNGPNSSEGETCPPTSQHDFGQPSASSSCEASGTPVDFWIHSCLTNEIGLIYDDLYNIISRANMNKRLDLNFRVLYSWIFQNCASHDSALILELCVMLTCQMKDTKRDVPGSTASESADPRSQKGSNLSRSS